MKKGLDGVCQGKKKKGKRPSDFFFFFYGAFKGWRWSTSTGPGWTVLTLDVLLLEWRGDICTVERKSRDEPDDQEGFASKSKSRNFILNFKARNLTCRIVLLWPHSTLRATMIWRSHELKYGSHWAERKCYANKSFNCSFFSLLVHVNPLINFSLSAIIPPLNISVRLSPRMKLWEHMLHRVHRATGVQCWPWPVHIFPSLSLCSLHTSKYCFTLGHPLGLYGGHFDGDGCAGALLPSNGGCRTHSAALHSTLPWQRWAVNARHWEDGLETGRATESGAKGEGPPHWKASSSRWCHAGEACSGGLWTGVEEHACVMDAKACSSPPAFTTADGYDFKNAVQ